MTYRDLMRLANGYAESKVLLVANERGLYTAIEDGASAPTHWLPPAGVCEGSIGPG